MKTEESPGSVASAHAGWIRFGRAVLVVAVVVVAICDATLGAHSDDVTIITATRELSYGELFRTPFFGSFFRPIVTLLLKAAGDVFGDPTVPIRVLHATLIVAMLAMANSALARRVGPMATTVSLLALLGSPFTVITAMQFEVGIADLIVAIALLASIDATFAPGRPNQSLRLLILSSIAILSKESGLLVAVFGIVSSLQRRRFPTAIALAVMSACFVAWRSNVVPHVDFVFGTGYFFEFLDPSELRDRFGGSRGGFYVYNVLASLSTVATSEPSHGFFDAALTDIVYVPIVCATSFVVARHVVRTAAWKREYAPLMAVIGANAAFGYMYVRPRIMFAAYTAIAFLLGCALDRTVASNEPVLGIRSPVFAKGLLAAWTTMLVAMVVRVIRFAIQR